MHFKQEYENGHGSLTLPNLYQKAKEKKSTQKYRFEQIKVTSTRYLVDLKFQKIFC